MAKLLANLLTVWLNTPLRG